MSLNAGKFEESAREGAPFCLYVHHTDAERESAYDRKSPIGRLQALGIAWDTRGRAYGGQRWFHLYPGETLRPSVGHWHGPWASWASSPSAHSFSAGGVLSSRTSA